MKNLYFSFISNTFSAFNALYIQSIIWTGRAISPLCALKGCVTMPRLVIEGGYPVNGEITIQGAKNSALPVLAASILCNTSSVIHNCPDLSDVQATLEILKYLGCSVIQNNGTVTVDPSGLQRTDIPDNLMREMRSSIVFLGAIIAKAGYARISFPGGCELGPRPIDLHLSSLKLLGLSIEEDHGYLKCNTPNGLKGTNIALSFPSVGATENIILAACKADGVTTVINAAREPEITDLANYLNRCGAKIYGAGESIIQIEGVSTLHGCEHNVIPDRIVAATYMAAGAITGGEITLHNVSSFHLSPVIPVFEEAGCIIVQVRNMLHIKRKGVLKAVKSVRTMPYPGFPTDAQAPLMAMATVAQGTSMFIENIFENRYKHVAELIRLGARIKVEGRVAVVEGVEHLYGAPVEATDLRGGAALVIAALAAEGKTEILGIRHIDRGYDKMEKSLKQLGCSIERIN